MIGNIYNEDCLTTMSKMSDNFVDMVFTSPPFKEEDVDGDYWQLYDKWFNEIVRVTSKVICIIHSATKLNYIVQNYPSKRIIIWGKGISKYSWRWNPIFLYQKSENYKINKYIWCDVFGVQSVNGKWKVHKYQDPLILYQTIIGMFKDCQSVYDPFCGSGTTIKACIVLNKDWIGSEIDGNCIKIINEQIAQQELNLK